MTSILILSLICFTFIASFRADLAVLLIVALLPSYLIRFSVVGIPFTYLEAMILISFGLWFVRNYLPNIKNFLSRTKFPKLAYPFGWEIIIITIISFLAVLNSNFSTSALGIWKAYFFEPILLYILIINIWPTIGRKKILIALMVGAMSVSILAIFQQITGLSIANTYWAAEKTRRVVSFFGYPNAVGLYLAPLIPILIGWVFSLKSQRITKYLASGVVIISFLSILFAKSEGAIIGLGAALFVFCLLANKYLRITALLSAVVGIIIILSVTPLRTFAVDKLLLKDLSGEIRKQQWRETLVTFEGWNIITGNGLSGYQTAVRPFHQEGIFFNRDGIENFHSILYGSAELRAKYWQPVEIYMYPHNIVLNFWTELGLLGVLIFAWLIVKYLILSYRLTYEDGQTDFYALGLLCSMIVIIVHGLVDVPYFKNDLSVMFFIFLALLGVLRLETNLKK